MKTKLFLLLSLLVIGFSCYKEDAVTPTKDEERFINIDSLKHQGTNIYQERLINYFDKYGTLTLYCFDPLLFEYEITSRPLYQYKKAEEPSVGALLDLIDEVFYAQLGTEVILRYAPLNVLLVSDLQRTDGQKPYSDCYFGLYSLTFSGADARIATWDKARKQLYKNNVLYNYLNRMVTRGQILNPINFYKVTDYINNGVTAANYKEFGYIVNKPERWHSKVLDFQDYLMMAISTTSAQLNAPGGLLDPAVDKRGLIKKKYDLLLKFYKEYEIDLEKIANYEIKD